MKKTASREIAKKSAPMPASGGAAAGGATPLGLPSARAGVTPSSIPASAAPTSPNASTPGTTTAPGSLAPVAPTEVGTLASANGAITEEGTGKHSATTDAADRIIATNDAIAVAAHAENLTSDKPTTATASARILDDLLLKSLEGFLEWQRVAKRTASVHRSHDRFSRASRLDGGQFGHVFRPAALGRGRLLS